MVSTSGSSTKNLSVEDKIDLSLDDLIQKRKQDRKLFKKQRVTGKKDYHIKNTKKNSKQSRHDVFNKNRGIKPVSKISLASKQTSRSERNQTAGKKALVAKLRKWKRLMLSTKLKIKNISQAININATKPVKRNPKKAKTTKMSPRRKTVKSGVAGTAKKLRFFSKRNLDPKMKNKTFNRSINGKKRKKNELKQVDQMNLPKSIKKGKKVCV